MNALPLLLVVLGIFAVAYRYRSALLAALVPGVLLVHPTLRFPPRPVPYAIN